MGYTTMDDQMPFQEAAAAGIRSMENLIFQLQQKSASSSKATIECREIADQTVSKFNNMISILNRIGHARFRRGPFCPILSPVLTPTPQIPNPNQQNQAMVSPVLPLQNLKLDFTNPSSIAEGSTDLPTMNDSFCISTPSRHRSPRRIPPLCHPSPVMEAYLTAARVSQPHCSRPLEPSLRAAPSQANLPFPPTGNATTATPIRNLPERYLLTAAAAIAPSAGKIA